MSDGVPLVLIVNHYPEVVLLLSQVVTDLGYDSAVIANDGKWQTEGYSALLSFIDERVPDAVLFDVPPPYEETSATVRDLVRDSILPADRWILLSTAHDLAGYFSEDAPAVLQKPFDLEDLTAILERVVGGVGEPGAAVAD